MNGEGKWRRDIDVYFRLRVNATGVAGTPRSGLGSRASELSALIELMESRARSVSHRTQALTRESTSVMTTAFDAWVLSLPPLPPPYPSVRSTAAIMYGYEWSPRRVRDSNRRGTPGPHRRHFASVRIVNGVGPAPRGNRRFSTMGDPRAVEAKLFFFPIPGGCHSHD